MEPPHLPAVNLGFITDIFLISLKVGCQRFTLNVFLGVQLMLRPVASKIFHQWCILESGTHGNKPFGLFIKKRPIPPFIEIYNQVMGSKGSGSKEDSEHTFIIPGSKMGDPYASLGYIVKTHNIIF